jgi:hypothetical protein
MTAFVLPAPDAPAQEWGRLAVAIPGWRWMRRMVSNHGATYLGAGCWIDGAAAGAVYADPNDGEVPDPDDPATAGCLLALLGSRCLVRILPREGRALYEVVIPSGLTPDGRPHRVNGTNLGRACIAAAAALGRWPGGTP